MKHGGATVFLVALVQISAFKPDADPQLLPESSGRDYSLSRDWAADFRLWVRLILGLAVAWLSPTSPIACCRRGLRTVCSGGPFAEFDRRPQVQLADTFHLRCPDGSGEFLPMYCHRRSKREVWHQRGLASERFGSGLLEFT